MKQHLSSSWLSESTKAGLRNAHWLAAAAGLAACAVCGIVLLGQPLGTSFAVALAPGNGAASTDAAIGVSDETQEGGLRLLAGVSGETFVSGASYAVAQDEIAGHSAPDATPVLWDDLPDASCLTITTKGGKTFSFRVLGTHPATSSAKAVPHIELAIAGCANNGETVVKAVIEQERTPAAKSAIPARSL